MLFRSIRDIGEMYDIKGFNHSPLEREKVAEFVARLGDIQRRQQREFEKLQVSSSRLAKEHMLIRVQGRS